MSGDADGFLERIREVPDDDAPRLIFADWLDEIGDPDRAEFVRVQVALARLARFDQARTGLVRRERQLLDRHADRWAAHFQGKATGPVFRRGLVDEIKVSARQFVAFGADLFAADPVRHVHLLDLGDCPAALASPLLARLTGLTVYAQRLGERSVCEGLLARAVAEAGHLSNLRRLHLGRNRLGDAGVGWLADAPHLAGLEDLDLSENELTDGAAWVLAGCPRFANLRRLELGGNDLSAAGAAAVAGSGYLARLDRLGLRGNALHRRPTGAGLGGLTRVAALDLSDTQLGPAGLGELLADRLRVRALDLSATGLGDAGAVRLAEAAAVSDLRRLRLQNNRIGDAGLAALAQSPHLRRLGELDVTHNPVGTLGLRAVLRPGALPALKALAYPKIGVSFRVRQALEMRFRSPDE
ncbi:MAG: TIGR02996 domain-containing protein [Gemmataceae bacterium]